MNKAWLRLLQQNEEVRLKNWNISNAKQSVWTCIVAMLNLQERQKQEGKTDPWSNVGMWNTGLHKNFPLLLCPVGWCGHYKAFEESLGRNHVQVFIQESFHMNDWLINLLTDCSVLKLYWQYFSSIRMENPIESRLFLIKTKEKKLYLSFWKIVNILVLVKDKKESTMNHQICVHCRRKICCKPWFGVHIQQLLSCFSEIVAEYLV